jgi:putative hydrolase of the HAD superfamily
MIFFDIDDTLLDNQGAETSAALEFHQRYAYTLVGSANEFAHRWRMVTEKHVQRYLSGELSFQGQRRERLKEIFSGKHTLSDLEADNLFEKYLEAYERNWRLFPDVLPCLEELGQYKLGIISNGNRSQQTQKLIATGIHDRFELIVISGAVGISKPDPRIFIEACRVAQLSPSESWHIGDNFEADYAGSLSAGMTGIWLNRRGMASIQGVKSIKSLSEAVGYLN